MLKIRMINTSLTSVTYDPCTIVKHKYKHRNYIIDFNVLQIPYLCYIFRFVFVQLIVMISRYNVHLWSDITYTSNFTSIYNMQTRKHTGIWCNIDVKLRWWTGNQWQLLLHSFYHPSFLSSWKLIAYTMIIIGRLQQVRNTELRLK